MTTERAGRRHGAAASAVAAGPFAQPRRLARTARADPAGWLAGCLALEIEQRRLFPWIAVAYGAGIGLAFAADGPLSPWPPLVAAAAFAAASVAARARPGTLALCLALAAIFAGFAAAVVRTALVEAPVLGQTVVGRMTGFVESVEERQAGGRIVIRPTSLDRVDEGRRPARIRVTSRSVADAAPGDHVGATVRLMPPPEAARPGGYDFARDAYFRGIGAVGSVSGRLTKVEPPIPPDLRLRAAAAIDRARNVLTQRIAGAIGGQAGAVAAALVTGKRGLIDEATNEALRAAGIYHVVSISGLHMMLAAGVFFWLARALLALSPTLALTWPCKKIAACVGMAGAGAYCVFSGSDVAAERSLCMILVMQGAILFDRPALSMRNLAISAIVVLTREPETLLGPSLQMSYAAVAGLIALAEWNRGRRRPAEPGDPIGRALRWAGMLVVATVATTAAATVATGPFASYHFQNLQPYGIIGNAATLPLVSLVVMPCAVAGTLAYPFGLDAPVWWVMGQGVEAMLRLAHAVAGFGGSVVVVPAFGAGALLLCVASLLCITILVSDLRWFAALPLALGLFAAANASRPDIYVARDGSGAAIRGREGALVVVGRVSAFTVEQWLKADGDRRRATDPTVRSGARCDAIGCTVPLRDGRVVSYLEDRRGFAEDCGRAALVVSRLAAPAPCAARLIDRAHLAEHGATAILARSGAFDILTVRKPGDTRPWLTRPTASARLRPRIPAAAPPSAETPGAELPPAEPPEGLFEP